MFKQKLPLIKDRIDKLSMIIDNFDRHDETISESELQVFDDATTSVNEIFDLMNKQLKK